MFVRECKILKCAESLDNHRDAWKERTPETNRYNIRNAEKNYIFIWVSYCQNMKNCEAFRKAITSSINLIYLEKSTYMYQDSLSNIKKSLISDKLVVDLYNSKYK